VKRMSLYRHGRTLEAERRQQHHPNPRLLLKTNRCFSRWWRLVRNKAGTQNLGRGIDAQPDAKIPARLIVGRLSWIFRVQRWMMQAKHHSHRKRCDRPSAGGCRSGSVSYFESDERTPRPFGTIGICSALPRRLERPKKHRLFIRKSEEIMRFQDETDTDVIRCISQTHDVIHNRCARCAIDSGTADVEICSDSDSPTEPSPGSRTIGHCTSSW
jgi:hypothetical protein